MAQLPLPKATDAGLSVILTRWKSILDPLLSSSGTVSIIGEQKSAYLTLDQFQRQAGKGWVLANGSSCKGSAYEQITGNSNVPDARGTVPRMKDNGKGLNPAGDLAIGSYQPDAFQGHFHSDGGHFHVERGFTSATSLPGGTAVTAGSNGDSPSASNTASAGANVQAPSSDGTDGTPRIGKETCAKSTTLNFFIRIN